MQVQAVRHRTEGWYGAGGGWAFAYGDAHRMLACGIETTVPFKPTQGRPVLCRQCFQSNRTPTTGALVTAAATAEMAAVTLRLPTIR